MTVPVRRKSWSISTHFIAFHAFAAIIAKKSLKIKIFNVWGWSRSSMLTHVKSSSPVFVMISSMPVPICNHFHVRRANSGRITSFRRGVPLSPPRLCRPLSHSGMKFFREILETLGYHTVKTRSLYLTWSWIGTGSCQTDRRTDGRTGGQNSNS